jgi:hypothetical protein
MPLGLGASTQCLGGLGDKPADEEGWLCLLDSPGWQRKNGGLKAAC